MNCPTVTLVKTLNPEHYDLGVPQSALVTEPLMNLRFWFVLIHFVANQ